MTKKNSDLKIGAPPYRRAGAGVRNTPPPTTHGDSGFPRQPWVTLEFQVFTLKERNSVALPSEPVDACNALRTRVEKKRRWRCLGGDHKSECRRPLSLRRVTQGVRHAVPGLRWCAARPRPALGSRSPSRDPRPRQAAGRAASGERQPQDGMAGDGCAQAQAGRGRSGGRSRNEAASEIAVCAISIILFASPVPGCFCTIFVNLWKRGCALSAEEDLSAPPRKFFILHNNEHFDGKKKDKNQKSFWALGEKTVKPPQITWQAE